MNADGVRKPHMLRYNHCRTSPVYREKCKQINTRRADRYKEHPALFIFYRGIIRHHGIEPVLAELPEGTTVQKRRGDKQDYFFIMNFTPEPCQIDGVGTPFSKQASQLRLPPFGIKVLQVTQDQLIGVNQSKVGE